MAKLTNYTAPVSSPDASFQRATPESMGAAVGAGLETVSKGVHHFYTQMEEDEARSALVANAQIRADAAAELDAAQMSGAPTESIKEKMLEKLSAVGDNFNTKKGLQSLALHSAQSTLMFDEQANRIAVHRAAETATLQGELYLEKQSKLLRSSPSMLPIILRENDDFIATVNASPTKRALMAQDLKTKLNMAAVMSSVRIDAPGTKEKLEAGEWDLTPQEREQGVHAAETKIRELRTDAHLARQEADYEVHKASEAASDTVLKNLHAGNLKDADIFNNADILPNKKEDLLHFKEWYTTARTDRLNKPHPEEMLRLWNIIHADSEDPKKVYNSDPVLQSANAHKLNAIEAERALGWVANQKDENNRSIGSKMTRAMGEVGRAVQGDLSVNWSPAQVAAIQMDYQSRVEDRVAELRKANENPNQVFEPKNKNFVGSVEFINESIKNVKNRVRATSIGQALSGPVDFPDGTRRVWSGKEPKTDINNWTVTEQGGLVSKIPQ